MAKVIPSRRAVLRGAGALAIGAAVSVPAVAATTPQAEYEALSATLRHMLEMAAKGAPNSEGCPYWDSYFASLNTILDSYPNTLLAALVRYHCGYGSAHPDDNHNYPGREYAEYPDLTADLLERDLWRLAAHQEPNHASEFRALLAELYATVEPESV
jgi:hypothetical protein